MPLCVRQLLVGAFPAGVRAHALGTMLDHEAGLACELVPAYRNHYDLKLFKHRLKARDVQCLRVVFTIPRTRPGPYQRCQCAGCRSQGPRNYPFSQECTGVILTAHTPVLSTEFPGPCSYGEISLKEHPLTVKPEALVGTSIVNCGAMRM